MVTIILSQIVFVLLAFLAAILPLSSLYFFPSLFSLILLSCSAISCCLLLTLTFFFYTPFPSSCSFSFSSSSVPFLPLPHLAFFLSSSLALKVRQKESKMRKGNKMFSFPCFSCIPCSFSPCSSSLFFLSCSLCPPILLFFSPLVQLPLLIIFLHLGIHPIWCWIVSAEEYFTLILVIVLRCVSQLHVNNFHQI